MTAAAPPPNTTGWSSAITRPLPAVALLTLLVVGVYGYGATTNGFAVDDGRFILENPFVGGEGAWWRAFTDPMTVDARDDGGIVRPLRTLEYRLDRSLGGGAAVFHWHSLLWHVLASAAVFGVLRKLLSDARAALAAAAVWALHPMHVESVAAIGFRADVAMGACVAGALLATLRSNGRDRWLVLALSCGALGMLWKETAAVLPLLVFAVHLVRPAGAGKRMAGAVRAALPFVGLVALYAVYRFGFIEGADSHVGYRIGGSVAGVFATMFRGFGVYLWSAVLPVDPSFDWYLPASRSLADPAALCWLFVHVGVIAGAIALYRRGRTTVLASALLFYGALLPVANWPFDLGIPTTERFLYLPLVGFALLVGSGVRRARSRGATLAVWLAAFALGSIAAQRVPDWRDDETIFAATLARHDSVRGHTWVGNRHRERGWELRRASSAAESQHEFEQALAHLDAAVAAWKRQIDPWPPRFHIASVPLVNASNAALALGRDAEALAYAEEALAIRPDSPQAHYNRAWALLRLARPAEAAEAMQIAHDVGLPVDAGEGFRFLEQVGRLLQESGQMSQARRAYEKALSLVPTGPAADRLRATLARLPR